MKVREHPSGREMLRQSAERLSQERIEAAARARRVEVLAQEQIGAAARRPLPSDQEATASWAPRWDTSVSDSHRAGVLPHLIAGGRR